MAKSNLRGHTRLVDLPDQDGPFVKLTIEASHIISEVKLAKRVLGGREATGVARIEGDLGRFDTNRLALTAYTCDSDRDTVNASIYLRTVEDANQLLNAVTMAKHLLIAAKQGAKVPVVVEGGSR